MHAEEAGIGPAPAVAITGSALRFPGASDPASFHELTVAGRRMFRELSHLADGGAAGGRGRRGGSAARRPLLAALLDDSPLPGGGVPGAGPGREDDLAHGIPAGHLIAAATAAAALADIPPAGRAVAPGRTGLYLAGLPAQATADIGHWVRRQLAMHAPGGAAAGGGVRAGSDGPDVMPASPQLCSLRAVAAACEALNSGQFDLVLVGGVAQGVGDWAAGAASQRAGTRQVRVYDASPTGTLPGEGCGVVALMRAADARAAGVPAYAEIAGWHYAQPAALDQAVPGAYRRAGIDPAEVQFVEGHGAATADDDLAELSALAEVLGSRARGAAGRCALGAVSANIGDTRSAAGMAALLKTVFAMTADTIPPATGCERPHRLLRGKEAPFRLPSVPEQWPQTPVQLAAVNTLGAAPRPDAPRSGPVHVVLRRERDPGHRPGRRRKPSPAG
jgi:Beta-ketoacyl synthase, C-terminal domain/Beta-ketoacyl synthase, N-terminal domain